MGTQIMSPNCLDRRPEDLLPDRPSWLDYIGLWTLAPPLVLEGRLFAVACPSCLGRFDPLDCRGNILGVIWIDSYAALLNKAVV